jgi:hypothetical protein
MRIPLSAAVLMLLLAGCTKEPTPQASVPSNVCIETAKQYVPLGTPRDKATAALEAIGLSCVFKKDNPYSTAEGEHGVEDIIWCTVAEPESVFVDSRYVPALIFEDDVVVEIRANPRRSMKPTNNTIESDKE